MPRHEAVPEPTREVPAVAPAPVTGGRPSPPARTPQPTPQPNPQPAQPPVAQPQQPQQPQTGAPTFATVRRGGYDKAAVDSQICAS